MIGMIRSSRKHDSKNIENCQKRPFPNEDRLHHADITWLGFNALSCIAYEMTASTRA